MRTQDMLVLGGDAFSDVFRALYDLKCFWKLTDPGYCISVMRSAYSAGIRTFDFSFEPVQQMFEQLRDQVPEPVTGIGNPTWLQGCRLDGTDLQYLRGRVLKTLTEDTAFLGKEKASLIRDDLSQSNCMVFGYDKDAKPFTEAELARLELDEDAYNKRLDGLKESTYMFVGGTDADWLFSLGREDIIVRMTDIASGRGFKPLLLCQYASVVLPKADRMKLPVEAYFAPVNMEWSFLTHKEGMEAVLHASKPVVSFMAFACGGLKTDMRKAAEWLKEECHVQGIMYGTSKPENARKTAVLLRDVYK